MTPIAIRDIQMASRGARRGTIRTGRFDGKPTKSETFILTSPDEAVLRSLPFGGDVLPYEAQGERSNDRWQIDTGTDVLRVRLATYGYPLTQRYELYGKGGLVRDCDGVTVKTVDPKTGEMIEQPCMCSDEKRECKLASRLSVVLSDAPTFGTWLLTTGSENAAYELTFAVNMLMEADRIGATVPAILRLEQRQVKKQGEKYPRRFAVPVLDADPLATRELMSGKTDDESVALPEPETPQIEAGDKESEPPDALASEDDPPLTDDQRKKLFVEARKLGISDERVRQIARDTLGHGISEMRHSERKPLWEAINAAVMEPQTHTDPTAVEG